MNNRYKNWLRQKFRNRENIFGLRFTTTWRCDSKCTTCSIWKLPLGDRKELSIEEIDKFSKSNYFKNVEYITLSGGEPTRRDDLPDIFRILHANIPKATISITMHGMQPERSERMVRQIVRESPNLRFGTVGLSINGPADIHDMTRGIQGAFEKTIETYDRIKNLVPCRFSFTFCKDNVEYFKWVREFAQEKGTSAYICWTVMNDRFRVSEEDLVFWRPGMEKLLSDYAYGEGIFPKTLQGVKNNILRLPPGITLSYLYDHIINEYKMPCYAGTQIIHVDPFGDVYPCNFKLSEDRIIGNLRNNSFDEVWEAMPKNILKEISNCECMYPNGLCGDSDIYPSICNCPPAVIGWYLKKIFTNKPLVHVPSN